MRKKVVCKICKSVLQEGDIGAPTEEKICTGCVIASTPAAPEGRILGANGRRLSKPKPHEEKTTLDFYYAWITDAKGCRPQIVIEELDYYKRVKFKISFPRGQLEDWAQDLLEMEKVNELSGSPEPSPGG